MPSFNSFFAIAKTNNHCNQYLTECSDRYDLNHEVQGDFLTNTL